MIIQTSNAKFLIESCGDHNDFVLIYSDLKEEIVRFFGSSDIREIDSFEYSYQIKCCKQEFANALIIMVKEIDYSNFWNLDFQVA